MELQQIVNNALGLETSSIVTLDVAAAPGESLDVVLPVGEELYTVQLDPHSVRADSYQVLAYGADGALTPVPASAIRTLRGTIDELPGSVVAGSLLEDGLHLFMRLPDGRQLWAEPIAHLPGAELDQYAVFNDDDVIPSEGTCGNDAHAAQALVDGVTEDGPRLALGGQEICGVTEIAMDADFEYFNIWGSVEGVENRINSIMNAVNTQYDEDVSITHLITAIIVRTEEPDPYTSFDAFGLLSQFRNEWLSNHQSIDRDVAHLFTGKNLSGTTIGIAFDIGAICTSNAYALSQAECCGGFNCATDLVAHELGHLWGAFHCSCPGFTMHTPLQCGNQFTAGSINSISNHRDSRNCLDCPEQGAIHLPLIDNFADPVIDNVAWTGIDGAGISTEGVGEPSPPYAVNLNGSNDGGDQLRSAIVDLSSLSDIKVKYWFQKQGDGDEPEAGEDLVVEYRRPSGDWTELTRHLATDGGIPTGFTPVSIDLPGGAYHSTFRLRFRVISQNQSADDWFVDSVCIGDAAQCDCALSLECDDGVACTTDTCLDTFCLNVPDNGACDDGVACTDNICNGATGCDFVANNANCDDGVGCTLDTCDAVAGCSSSADDAACDDGNNCTTDLCDAVADCQYTVIEDCSGVQGLVVADATDPDAAAMGLQICNVRVQFGSFDDVLLNVGFSNITTDDPAGFYQHPLGSDTAPGQQFIDVFPDLAFDSYVDIGYKVVPIGVEDTTALDPDFDSSLFNNGGAVVGGWFNSNPTNSQGVPDANRQVFIAQFAVNEGFSVSGTLSVFFNDGVNEIPLTFECVALSSCPADLNNDGTVDSVDLAQLLGAWGLCAGCPADLNGDGEVDANDLAELLGSWGPC